MRQSGLAFPSSIWILIILAVTDAAAATQARLHGSPRARTGAAEIVVRLADPAAAAWVRITTNNSTSGWRRIEDDDKRECSNEVHLAVLAVPGPDRAGAQAVRDAVQRALSGLRPQNLAIEASMSVVLRQVAVLNPLRPWGAAAKQMEEEYGRLGATPVAADVVDALQKANALLNKRWVQQQGKGRYLVFLVIDGTVDLEDPARMLEATAKELTGSDSAIELYRIAADVDTLPLDYFAGFAGGRDLAIAGDTLREMIATCDIIRVGGLEPGMHTIQLGNGPSSPTWTSDEVQVRIESSGVTAKRGDRGWWVWALVGGASVLLGGTLWMATLGRRRGIPMRFTQPVPAGRVSVVLKTIPLQPAGGQTPPISPVVADARGTVHQLPSVGLAAWLVVYRDDMPCETLVLQTTGITTIGREGSTSICLEDTAVSKRHATIMATSGRFVLEDSTDPRPQNPTKVDGKLLKGPIELQDNMWLQIGSTRLRFKCTA